MRRISPLLVISAVVGLAVAAGGCGYKKSAKRIAPNALECEASLVKASKRKDVVTAKGCGNQAKYMWYCEEKKCKLLSFEEGLQEGAFAADCSPDEMTVSPHGRGQITVNGCEKSVLYKATLNGWEQVGDVE